MLPNGEGVLFTALSDAWEHLALLSYDTGDVTYLGVQGAYPHYSPTGHIVYRLGNRLWAVGFDQDRLEPTAANPVPVLENVQTESSGAGNLSLSANGALVYLPTWSGRAQDRTLAWVDHQGRGEPVAAEPDAY